MARMTTSTRCSLLMASPGASQKRPQQPSSSCYHNVTPACELLIICHFPFCGIAFKINTPGLCNLGRSCVCTRSPAIRLDLFSAKPV